MTQSYTEVSHLMEPVVDDSNDNISIHQLSTVSAFNGNLDCPFCFDLFKTVEELRAHKRDHHKNKYYVCKLCLASFMTQLGWQHHYNGHNSDLQYSCDSCNVKFNSFQQLVQHIERHKYYCKSCDKAFVKREQLHLHERNEHNIMHEDCSSKKFIEHRCPKCNEIFPSHKKLIKHRKENNQCAPYSCLKCGIGFLSEIHLQSHTSHFKNCRKVLEKRERKKFKLRIATIRVPRLEMARMRIEELKSYICNNCDQSFSKIQLRREHWIRQKNCRPYGCSHCNAKFVNKKDIEVHVRYHMHKCLQCLRRFINKSDFENHSCKIKKENPVEVEISTEKNFKCLYCYETYFTEQKLQEHIDYDSENLFICSECYDTFYNECTFGYHVMIAHGVDKSEI